MKKLFLFSIAFIAALCLLGQTPVIEWQKSLGGTEDDFAYSIQQTSDGGYIVAGSSNSNDGDVTGQHSTFLYGDYWIVKLDSLGNIQWQKSIGGSKHEVAESIQQTADRGYIIAGSNQSLDGDVYPNIRKGYWVVKLDSSGNIQLQRSFGGYTYNYAHSIQQTSDGKYIVAGESGSNDGDVTGHHGDLHIMDFWIIKIDQLFGLEWQKSLGAQGNDKAFSIQQTSDGGYIVAGWSESADGDVTGNKGLYDYWVVKLDTAGTIKWQKSLGGSKNDCAQSIQQTIDGGYIVAGVSYSNDGDVSEIHDIDYWIVKLDTSGNIQWQRCFGGIMLEKARSIKQTKDKGYIIAGYSMSDDGDITGHHGSLDSCDYWIVKLDSAGDIEWQKSLGGSGNDYAESIEQTKDGGYIIAGRSNSNNGDVSGHHGSTKKFDYWIVKLFGKTIGINEHNYNTNNLTIYPNPAGTQITIDLKEYRNQDSEVRIYNVNGQELLKQIVNDKQQTDISCLPAGVYFVKLISDKNVCVGKFVKD